MQRLLLEVTYEALENSGTTLSKVSGTRTSCFVGCFTKDYEEMQRRDMETAPKYQSTGASPTMLSNRLSYYFNLKGPSVTLDTACSSGLVAVHLACQSLQAGESSMAIVGGSNLILSPDIQIEMSDMHFLSPDSISYAFDERANGYARGEGIGVIILKPLDLALEDKDPIRAVIRGTAASSDGKTSGITLPSKDAQIELIRSAYRAAGCDTSLTGYFEAHGTGTAAGDPIEAGAIGEVFAPHRPIAANGERIPLIIGSLKTNIGHLEGASGVAGLIKAVLTVEKGIIAPNVWFKKGNPRINFEAWRLQVPTEVQTWPWKGLRRASVNSFGYGGTNAHIVIDDGHDYSQQHDNDISGNRAANNPLDGTLRGDLPRNRVFVLSANDIQGPSAIGEQLAKYLQEKSGVNEGGERRAAAR
jgi:acyl transferase domain-containing protein